MNINNKDLYEERLTGVIELKLYNFNINSLGEVIVTHPRFINTYGLIMFYKPSCPHCNSNETRKLWSDLAMLMGKAFPIGAVNCSSPENGTKELTEYAKILGYPTIKLVHKDGTMSLYQGRRTQADILNFICVAAKKCL